MNRVKELKKQLGETYAFERLVNRRELPQCMKTLPPRSEQVLATLTAGCLRIQAVAFTASDEPQLGYDVLVRETPDTSAWICYDTPPDTVSLKETDMLAVLDRVAQQNELSYTDCRFERLVGKSAGVF